ncbi:MAG: DUF4349 domain-containing protein [Candidatus Methanoperedens sp.]|nr:DUF4349 domain-containing protein [Candidatus Methanoperedens sp.]
MNKRLVVLAGILLLVAAAGCIASQKYSQQVPSASDFSYSMSESRDSLKTSGTDAYDKKSASQDRKIISTAHLQMEVSNVKDTFNELTNITLSHGGYISSSSVYDSGNRNSGQVALRVPQRNFYSAIEQIEALGTVRSRQIAGQDVTEEFIDLNARLGNLQKQEVRLQEILKTAVTVKDVLEVEHELERVRGEIERLTGRLNYLNQSVEMSTIMVNAAEPAPFTGEDWGIADTFSQAARGFVESVRGLIIITGYILPILIFIVMIAMAALGIKRKLLPRLRT